MRLSEIIIHAPNIQNLRLDMSSDFGGELFGRLTCRRHLHPNVTLLSSLKSLTITGKTPNLAYLGLRATDMPNLTHLNICLCTDWTSAFNPSLGVLPFLGPQLHSLELQPCMIFDYHSDNVWQILDACPNLRELSYDIRNTRIIPVNSHTSLTRICLRNNSNSPSAWINEESQTTALFLHFPVFADSAAFPSLECVILVGNWLSIASRSRSLRESLGQFRDLLDNRGCHLEYMEPLFQ
jgi:hypothetical protein